MDITPLLLAFILTASSAENMGTIFCSAYTQLTKDYQWVESLPKGSMRIVYAIDEKGNVVKCVWIVGIWERGKV